MKLALAAMFAALGTLFLFVTALFPHGTVALLCITSACVAFAVMECGFRYGILSYIAISVLGFLITPDKSIVLWEFILFLGYYPLIKYLIERLNRLPVEWLIKVCCFAAASAALLWLFQNVLVLPLPEALPSTVYILGGVILLCIYDYALSLVLSFYQNRLKNRIKKF